LHFLTIEGLAGLLDFGFIGLPVTLATPVFLGIKNGEDGKGKGTREQNPPSRAPTEGCAKKSAMSWNFSLSECHKSKWLDG
jgi:hypothetical protein